MKRTAVAILGFCLVAVAGAGYAARGVFGSLQVQASINTTFTYQITNPFLNGAGQILVTANDQAAGGKWIITGSYIVVTTNSPSGFTVQFRLDNGPFPGPGGTAEVILIEYSPIYVYGISTLTLMPGTTEVVSLSFPPGTVELTTQYHFRYPLAAGDNVVDTYFNWPIGIEVHPN
jgi:hypothetical protein